MSTEDLIVYDGIQRISAMVSDYASKSPDLMMVPRRTGPNPFYNQTASGLYLEQYYSLPSTLWTPWGALNIGGDGSGNWDPVVALMVDRLGATVHSTLKRTEMGEYGPVYAISKVDDFVLPPPTMRRVADFMEYAECRRAWAKVSASARMAAHAES